MRARATSLETDFAQCLPGKVTSGILTLLTPGSSDRDIESVHPQLEFCSFYIFQVDMQSHNQFTGWKVASISRAWGSNRSSSCFDLLISFLVI